MSELHVPSKVNCLMRSICLCKTQYCIHLNRICMFVNITKEEQSMMGR